MLKITCHKYTVLPHTCNYNKVQLALLHQAQSNNSPPATLQQSAQINFTWSPSHGPVFCEQPWFTSTTCCPRLRRFDASHLESLPSSLVPDNPKDKPAAPFQLYHPDEGFRLRLTMTPFLFKLSRSLRECQQLPRSFCQSITLKWWQKSLLLAATILHRQCNIYEIRKK